MIRVYSSPIAFKTAVEHRLKQGGIRGLALQRRRQLLVFERLLARIQKAFGTRIVLKGGLALEIRLDQARTTRDVDIALLGDSSELLGKLQMAGQDDLGDFMSFEIRENRAHPTIVGDSVEYGGQRFRVECKLAGRIYGASFGLDVVFGGPFLGNPTVVQRLGYLDFAGIPAPTLRLLPLETHIAEKLHAYTQTRSVLNSRVRDLPDLALLATYDDPDEPIECERIRKALAQTFQARRAHDLPRSVPPPPDVWRDEYAALAVDHALAWRDLSTVTEAVQQFLDPVLDDTPDCGRWNRDTWSWSTR